MGTTHSGSLTSQPPGPKYAMVVDADVGTTRSRSKAERVAARKRPVVAAAAAAMTDGDDNNTRCTESDAWDCVRGWPPILRKGQPHHLINPGGPGLNPPHHLYPPRHLKSQPIAHTRNIITTSSYANNTGDQRLNHKIVNTEQAKS